MADEVFNILKEDGIEIYLNSETKEITTSKSKNRSDKTSINLTIKTSNRKKIIKGTHVLIAAGHTPNTNELNLSAPGVKTDDKGFIITNSKLETNVKGIYAMGDVKGGPAFTHISYDDFRIIKDNILDKKNSSTKGRMVPYVVFMDPQLGRVGMNEKEAIEKKIKYSVAKMPMNKVSRAIEKSETRGMMKVLVDDKTDKILGCTILGFEGGEIMAMIQIAILGDLKYNVLKNGIFAHPTLAESLNNLFSNV